MSTATSWYQPTVTAAPTIELAIFDISDVSFGIPIAKIDRILSNTNSSKPFDLPTGTQILDLHHHLFGIGSLNPAAYAIVRRDCQAMCCIPVDTLPTISTIPIDRIRTLPPELRATSPIGIASHVAMMPTSTGELTVFILEI
jgi:chemotaxis signal transduction protein